MKQHGMIMTGTKRMEMKFHEHSDMISKLNNEIGLLKNSLKEIRGMLEEKNCDRKISYFDYNYSYNGYALVNEIYEDDEGFDKNNWQWGKQLGGWVSNLSPLQGLSSNSYADRNEAIAAFKEKVKKMP